MQKRGAYLLVLEIKQSLELAVGSLKCVQLPEGVYAYVGSARSGIAQRIARHRRLAESKKGNIRWHIDYLLTHPKTQLVGTIPLAGAKECDISRRIAAAKGASTPVPNFGSTDCKAGCKAHLYRLSPPTISASSLSELIGFRKVIDVKDVKDVPRERR